jgi:Xaa-Pro aminopeptidase
MHASMDSFLRQSRIAEARNALAAAGADVVMVSSLPNVFYLCGFTGSNAILVVSPDTLDLFTDSRYTLQAREEASEAKVHIPHGPLTDAVGAFLRAKSKRGGLKVGYEPGHLNLIEWSRLEKTAGPKIRWKSAAGLIESLREIKSPAELDAMRRAAKLGSEVMAEAIHKIRAGMSELELAAEIDYLMRRKGASGPSFETIVASGPRAALPHAKPTAKLLEKSDLVVLDLGVILAHYCSDLTRTVCVGRATAKVRRWYRAVEQAQQAALEALKAGVATGKVDRAARSVLDRSSLGQYFTHSTGHGLGIEVHEPPRIGRAQKQKIRVGMVVTLEPGIYIEGVGGIRIEDDVAVHANGTEVLTSAPRGLLEL